MHRNRDRENLEDRAENTSDQGETSKLRARKKVSLLALLSRVKIHTRTKRGGSLG